MLWRVEAMMDSVSAPGAMPGAAGPAPAPAPVRLTPGNHHSPGRRGNIAAD